MAEVTLSAVGADREWSLDSTRERIEVLGGQVEQHRGRLVLRLPLIGADVPA
jgi:hypothetical protein